MGLMVSEKIPMLDGFTISLILCSLLLRLFKLVSSLHGSLCAWFLSLSSFDAPVCSVLTQLKKRLVLMFLTTVEQLTTLMDLLTMLLRNLTTQERDPHTLLLLLQRHTLLLLQVFMRPLLLPL